MMHKYAVALSLLLPAPVPKAFFWLYPCQHSLSLQCTLFIVQTHCVHVHLDAVQPEAGLAHQVQQE